MSNSRLRWLTIATNLGVILGLVLVVYELRLNNIALENETDVAVWSIGAEQAALVVDSNGVAELLTRAERVTWSDFSRTEQIRLGALWGSLVDRLELQYRMYKRRGEVLRREYIVFPEPFLEQVTFRQWWEVGKPVYQPDFAEYFQSLLDQAGDA